MTTRTLAALAADARLTHDSARRLARTLEPSPASAPALPILAHLLEELAALVADLGALLEEPS